MFSMLFDLLLASKTKIFFFFYNRVAKKKTKLRFALGILTGAPKTLANTKTTPLVTDNTN